MMVALAFITSLACIDRLDVMAAFLFCGYGFLGMIIPLLPSLRWSITDVMPHSISHDGTIQFITSAFCRRDRGPVRRWHVTADGHRDRPLLGRRLLLSMVVLRSRRGSLALQNKIKPSKTKRPDLATRRFRFSCQAINRCRQPHQPCR